MRATVLITHLDDARVEAAIESALAQGPLLQEVLVADGGSESALWNHLQGRFGTHPLVRFAQLPGTVAESRNQALARVKSELVAFLDADETAPPGWLEALTEPLRSGRADFTGGPTRPLHDRPRSGAEAYVVKTEAALYRDAVPHDLALLPMGNSCWRTKLLRDIGGFDPRLAWGGEDYDVNLRALASGARGVFVPAAWVHHDQSGIDSYRKVLRRKSRYYFGAATAYLKNDRMGDRARASARRFRPRHPIDLLDVVLKPWAWFRARRYYRRTYGPAKPPS